MDFIVTIPNLIIIHGFLFGSFLILRSNQKRPTIYLGLFILALSADEITAVLFDYGFIEKDRRLLLLPVNFYFLLMPLLYLYTKSFFTPLTKLRDYKPLLAGGIEFLVRGGIFVMAIVSEHWFKNNLSFISITIGIHFYGGLLYIIYYSYRIVVFINRQQNSLSNYYSTLNGRLLNWIKVIAWGMVIHAIFVIIFRSIARFHPNQEFTDTISMIILSNALLFFYWIIFMGVRQSSLLDFKQFKNSIKETNDASSDLKENQLFYNLLVDHMEKNKPYVDPHLTLSILAGQLKINGRKLSEVIKSASGKNFNQFVNMFRIENAMEMLRNPKFDNLSILGIANESGFKSKATFNTRFKEYANMTPSDFKKKRQYDLNQIKE